MTLLLKRIINNINRCGKKEKKKKEEIKNYKDLGLFQEKIQLQMRYCMGEQQEKQQEYQGQEEIVQQEKQEYDDESDGQEEPENAPPRVKKEIEKVEKTSLQVKKKSIISRLSDKIKSILGKKNKDSEQEQDDPQLAIQFLLQQNHNLKQIEIQQQQNYNELMKSFNNLYKKYQESQEITLNQDDLITKMSIQITNYEYQINNQKYTIQKQNERINKQKNEIKEINLEKSNEQQSIYRIKKYHDNQFNYQCKTIQSLSSEETNLKAELSAHYQNYHERVSTLLKLNHLNFNAFYNNIDDFIIEMKQHFNDKLTCLTDNEILKYIKTYIDLHKINQTVQIPRSTSLIFDQEQKQQQEKQCNLIPQKNNINTNYNPPQLGLKNPPQLDLQNSSALKSQSQNNQQMNNLPQPSSNIQIGTVNQQIAVYQLHLHQ